jgi:ketosteroid isomerase-like protein
MDFRSWSNETGSPMSHADENVAIVRAWLQAWGRGETDIVMAGMDPAIEIHSSREVGNEGTYRGLAGYRTWESRWMEAWEEFRNEILRVEPVGQEHVIVDVRQRATGRGSGVEVDREVSMLCQIRDGRMSRFHLYATHEHAVAAAAELDRLRRAPADA